jgi:hypothetical protein
MEDIRFCVRMILILTAKTVPTEFEIQSQPRDGHEPTSNHKIGVGRPLIDNMPKKFRTFGEQNGKFPAPQV